MQNPDSPTMPLIARLWRDYLHQYWWQYAFAIIFMTIGGAASAGLAHLVEPAIDIALSGNDKQYLILIALGFFGLSFGRGIATYIQVVILQNIGVKVIATMQSQMFHAIQTIDYQSLQTAGTANQLSRFSNDVNYLNNCVSKVFTTFGKDMMIIIFMLGLMFYKNWQLTLLALVFFPTAIYPVMVIGKKIRRLASNLQQQLANMMAVLDDSFKGGRHVRAYQLQPWLQQRADENFTYARNMTLKSTAIRTLTHPLMDGMAGFSIAVVLLWGGMQIMGGGMTKGEFFSFFVAIIGAYQPMRSMSSISGYLQEGLAACQRIFGIIDEKPTIPLNDQQPPLTLGNGAITMHNVHFAYPNNPPILNGFTAEFAGGKTTALVGESGGGKSTIINLIARLYLPQNGQILCDGQDYNQINLSSLLGKIAIVTQDSGLFNVSVKQNIQFGNINKSMDEIIQAAKLASADEFIQNLPQGYDSNCGELGNNLSGGQKQRILIARAFLKDAPILLLDEPTAALDAKTEGEIQESLLLLAKGRTCIIVAHRLSTIQRADNIIVLDQGKIIEQGNYQQLMAQNGAFAKMARAQSHA